MASLSNCFWHRLKIIYLIQYPPLPLMNKKFPNLLQDISNLLQVKNNKKEDNCIFKCFKQFHLVN